MRVNMEEENVIIHIFGHNSMPSLYQKVMFTELWSQ